jgi:hypothetical protein
MRKARVLTLEDKAPINKTIKQIDQMLLTKLEIMDLLLCLREVREAPFKLLNLQ